MAIINPHTSGDGTLFRIASKMISVLAAAALIAGFGLSSCTTGPAEQEAAPPAGSPSLFPTALLGCGIPGPKTAAWCSSQRGDGGETGIMKPWPPWMTRLFRPVSMRISGVPVRILSFPTAAGTDWNTRTRARYDGSAEDSAKVNMDADAIWRTEEATWVRFILDDPRVPVINWTPVYRGRRPGMDTAYTGHPGISCHSRNRW
jgi:hypothetical protein